ncbi:flagellar hook-length control protein FliK [Nitrosospira sp. Is2]|uniref:flagellar hook-length control protein FliK n=1 Tax=Nitrosospira sp. Is2 TaxID=3080532 RepID=UPI002954258C|nr:flagellar hook-length control protein FliK [Nitrosospira sp. Is2]WON73611.1 flagellar hook-length control protein FliK [Nitrosospira sp. Is2]
MLYPTILGPTAPAVAKNGSLAMDQASGGQASGTTGFSNLLEKEMDAQQNLPGKATGASGERADAASEANKAGEADNANGLPAGEPDIGKDFSIGNVETQARGKMPLGAGAASTQADALPRRANRPAMLHPDTRSPSAAAETPIKGLAEAQSNEGAVARGVFKTGDPAHAHTHIEAHSRADQQIDDPSVLPGGAPQIEIAASPPPRQPNDITAINTEPGAGAVAAAVAAAVATDKGPFAANGGKKDPAMAAVDGIQQNPGKSAEAPGVSRALAGRSAFAGDKPFRLDSGERQADFRQLEPGVQSSTMALQTEPLRKPLDLSQLPPNLSFTPVEIPVGSLPAEAGPASAAPAPAIGLPGDIASLEPRLGAAGWDNALGQKVLWMVSQQQQVAELNLNPPDLGPLQVVLSIDKDEANATFVSQHADVRQALEAALPRLREMMAESGITLNSATVSHEGARQHSGFERQGRPGGGRGGGGHDARTGALAGTSRIAIEPGRSRLVDTFA